jgi:radical SAM protein with 4Fe4S-binding SPASM domain
MYKDFDKAAGLLEWDPRETAISTNANLIEQNMDSLLKISNNLELLIGLEGFEEENDSIRGKGSFKKVINAVELLLKLREKGLFKGKISIHSVINDKMADKLYKFITFIENIGIDIAFICFPWYISEDCSLKMDVFFKDKLGFLNNEDIKVKKSWKAFKYKLSSQNIPKIMEEIIKINRRSWKMRVRYQPRLEFEEIEDFILGKELCKGRERKCLALSSRMDVNPDGSVSACKFFSEFVIGNLKDTGVREIWHSEKYNILREIINDGLMPVCSKCSVLHLHGV